MYESGQQKSCSMEEELPVSDSDSEDEPDILDPSDDVLEEETETETTGTETDKERAEGLRARVLISAGI